MGRGIIIFIIICMILSPCAFDTPTTFDTSTAHEVGNKQGDGDATPLDNVDVGNIDTIAAQSGGTDTPIIDTITDQKPLVDYPAVVFIVSKKENGELPVMTTTAILCRTISVGDGTYTWQGSDRNWANFDSRLHYTIKASGDKNGLISVTAEQYMFGEKTETPMYVRQVVGIGA